jgi:hypothetical protein
MAQNIYEDSYVTMWHGPRRGGKSASMAYDVHANLLAGKRCFADSPVSFDFQIDENYRHHYESERLDYLEFLRVDEPWFKKKYSNSVIAWDEIDKRMFSRNFMSVFAKFQSQFITLVGKLEMTFLMTAQREHLVDRNIREQIDALVMCIDLSFEYSHLQRGTTIGQSWRDMSGRFTGQMFDYSQQEYQQTFYAKNFWPIYDTKWAPSLVDSMQKFDIRMPKQVITLGDMDGAIQDANASGYQFDSNRETIKMMAEELRESMMGQPKNFNRYELTRMARERGFQGNDRVLFNRLQEQNLVSVGRNQYALV